MESSTFEPSLNDFFIVVSERIFQRKGLSETEIREHAKAEAVS